MIANLKNRRHSFESNFVYFVTSSLILPTSILIIFILPGEVSALKIFFYALAGIVLATSAVRSTRTTTFTNFLWIVTGSVFGKIAFGLVYAHRLILKGFFLPSFYVPVAAYLLVFALFQYRRANA